MTALEISHPTLLGGENCCCSIAKQPTASGLTSCTCHMKKRKGSTGYCQIYCQKKTSNESENVPFTSIYDDFPMKTSRGFPAMAKRWVASCILLISATAPSRASAKAGSTFCLHFTAASITWEVTAAWDMHGMICLHLGSFLEIEKCMACVYRPVRGRCSCSCVLVRMDV